jgi:hypothetical protein
MKILFAAVTILASILASPIYAKTMNRHHNSMSINHLAPNSPFAGQDGNAIGSKQPTPRFGVEQNDFQDDWNVSY